MPALTKSSILQLTGFDANIPASDMLYGETWGPGSIVFTTPTAATVTAVSGAVVTFAGAPSTTFTVGNYVSFTDDTNTYAITAINATANTLTLGGNPNTKIVGDVINQSLNLDPNTTFNFRLSQYQSTGVTETKNGLDLGTVTQVTPVVSVDLSTQVVPIDLTKGYVQFYIPANSLTPVPTPGDAPAGLTPIIFAGSLSLNRPQGASPTLNPATVNKQRFIFLIWSALA